LKQKGDLNMTGDEHSLSGEPAAGHLAQALPKLTPELIAEIAPTLKRVTYAPGETIIKQGDPPEDFYIVVRGKAEIYHEGLDGQVRVVDVRKPDEYFGEIGLIQNRPRNATVRASADSEVEVLTMERQDFQEMMEDSRATEMHVAQEMIRRLINLADAQ